jgi:hypothetical protein
MGHFDVSHPRQFIPVAHPGGSAHTRHSRRRTQGASRLINAVVAGLLLITLLPLAYTRYTSKAGPDLDDLIPTGTNTQICSPTDVECTGNTNASTSQASQQSLLASTPAPTPPACESLCLRIRSIYHDPRTQALLIPLAQTPTGRSVLEYLLFMGAKMGDEFISWQDLSAGHYAGFTTEGGYIQLNSRVPADLHLEPYFLAGTMVHEAVESYFVVVEGIRDMGTRHADYVAQWFSGKFQIELHAIPYYHVQDTSYWDGEYSSYGMSYSAWIDNSLDGEAYRMLPANCDLHAADRIGHSWPPSDWWAGWGFGQGTPVSPVPNTMGLSRSMLATDDMRVFS